jgi:tyrosyl-tRNA synthetase
MLKLPDEAMTKNTELKARSLQFDNNGEWLKAENFSMFTSREMSEIRTMVNLVDASYNPTTEIENPNTKEKMNYPIMYGKDFFYQEGI